MCAREGERGGVCERLTGSDLAYQWYVCEHESVCVPLDKSVCAPAFRAGLMAVLMHVRQHSLPQLCLRWSKAEQQETLRARSSFYAVTGGQHENTRSSHKQKHKQRLWSTGTHSLSSFLSGKDLTHTVIILQRSSDRISKYVEQTS